MGPHGELSAHVLRARRTAAVARAVVGMAGFVLVVAWQGLHPHPALAAGGFALIIVTAVIQLLAPADDEPIIEEALAALAAIPIVGLGDQHVTVLPLLWLCGVASGVMARGGRVHWLGSAMLLGCMVLPITQTWRLEPGYAGLGVGVLALLLTCGRLTRELNHLLDQARHDADHDGLTGALSRSAFRTELDCVIETHGSVGLVVVDLDDFGHVNKAHGHAAGDQLLADAVERMRTVAGPDCRLGRLGGDEFAVACGQADPGALARRLLDALAAGPGAIGGSIGVASGPGDGRDADALLRACDVALRVAKRRGKSQLVVYDGESLSDDGARGARGALQRLIAGDGLEMVLQPIIDTSTGVVHAYEALARFHTRGTDSPLHWFALADEFDMRPELEVACLSAALRMLERLPAAARLSVNVSGGLLLDQRVQALIEGVDDVSALIIEVTEGSLVREDAGILAAMEPLLERGVMLAVDDMGAGYSGLGQVTALRPGYLKLDRLLVQGIDDSPTRAALVEALVGYAKRTGGQIVAEGVERREELDKLSELGVTLVQGFYLGRPGPPPWGADPAGPAGQAETLLPVA